MQDPRPDTIGFITYTHGFLSRLVVAYFPLKVILEAIDHSQEAQLILTLQKVVDLHTHGFDEYEKRLLVIYVNLLITVKEWKRLNVHGSENEPPRDTYEDMMNLIELLLRRYLAMPPDFKKNYSFFKLHLSFSNKTVAEEIRLMKQYTESQQCNDLIQILTWLISQYEYKAIAWGIEQLARGLPSADTDQLIKPLEHVPATVDEPLEHVPAAVDKRKWKIVDIPHNRMHAIITDAITDLGYRIE